MGAQQPPPPNIILIFVDDLGYGDLGCYGNEKIATPNIDRLAAEGQRWTSFYASGSTCVPGRRGLMSGRHPALLGKEPLKNDRAGIVFGKNPSWRMKTNTAGSGSFDRRSKSTAMGGSNFDCQSKLLSQSNLPLSSPLL